MKLYNSGIEIWKPNFITDYKNNLQKTKIGFVLDTK